MIIKMKTIKMVIISTKSPPQSIVANPSASTQEAPAELPVEPHQGDEGTAIPHQGSNNPDKRIVNIRGTRKQNKRHEPPTPNQNEAHNLETHNANIDWNVAGKIANKTRKKRKRMVVTGSKTHMDLLFGRGQRKQCGWSALPTTCLFPTDENNCLQNVITF